MDEHAQHTAIVDLRQRRGPDPTPALPSWLNVAPGDWEEAWIAVLSLGLRVTGSLADAEDIRQQTYERLQRLQTTRCWDNRRPFVGYVLFIAASLLKNENTVRRRRERYEADCIAEYRHERGGMTASPEQVLIEREERAHREDRATRVLAELRRRLAGFPLELRLIDRAERAEARGDPFERPAELAKMMGVPVQDVYRAFEHIRAFRKRVYDAVDKQYRVVDKHYRSAGNDQAKP